MLDLSKNVTDVSIANEKIRTSINGRYHVEDDEESTPMKLVGLDSSQKKLPKSNLGSEVKILDSEASSPSPK